MVSIFKNVKEIMRAKLRPPKDRDDENAVRYKFRRVYREDLFDGGESRSGQGSGLFQTRRIREELPGLLRTIGASSMVDAPCGDFFWMKEVSLPVQRYVGVDVVPEVIRAAKAQYENGQRSFMELNIIEEIVPESDLILSRDCFVHLTFEQCFKIIHNFKKSRSRYLLATTFTDRKVNEDLGDGFWRTLNFEMPPFGFPSPEALIVEGCTERDGAYADKALGLWPLKKVPDRVR